MRVVVGVVAAGLVAAVGACNCGVTPVSTTTCAFEVTPTGDPGIQFPDTQVGHSSVRSWRLKNTSKGVTLNALQAKFESKNGENYATDIPPDLKLGVGEEHTFVITFTPTAATTLASSFTVSHPNVGVAQCPSVQVAVEGKGFVPQDVDAGPGEGEGEGEGEGQPQDAGTVNPPDGGITLPATGEWFAYGAFEDARARFAAVEAKDGSGDIIAVGGYGEDGAPLDSIERFNPAKGVSRIVGHMAVPRAEPALATLADGRIVILGGRSAATGGVALRTVEIFDPVHGDTLTCAETAGGCGLNDQGTAALPTGRIGAFASVQNGTVVFVLGRTLDGTGNEVPADGGETVTFSPTIAAGNLTNASLLVGRTGDARVLNTNANDGRFVVVGGQTLAGVAGDVLLVTSTGVSALPSLTHPRTLAGATLLSTGDLLVAGGASATGAPENHVEKVAHAFGGGTAAVSDVTLDLPARVGGSLVAMANDFVLWAGGTSTRTDTLTDANQSVVPLDTADVIVPFGGSGFVRLSPDNDLAQGRLDHVALPYASGGQGGTVDTVLFLGGTNTSPRRTPHPHIERYVAALNKFVTFGLMGAGTALEAGVVPNSGAALVSAGGIDPHTGSTSATVRAFDAIAGAYVDDGALREPRRDHTLTRIADTPPNALLVAGGRDENGVVLDSLSIYDSVNQTDHPLPFSLATARADHTATRLADDAAQNAFGPGAVLLCGGVGANGEALDSCEVFVPPTNPLDESTYGTARIVPVLGRLQTGRIGHTSTLLDSGEVLVVGGGDVTSDLVAGDLFDPRVDPPTLHATTGTPNEARTGHAAIFVGGGQVLLVGGETATSGVVGPSKTAEIYDRTADAFLPIASQMLEERANPAVFLLQGGDVLVAGGTRSNDPTTGLPTRSDQTSELWVASSQSFENLPNHNPLSYGRSDVLFVDVFGRAIVYGGDHRDGILGIGDERHTPITFVDFLEDPGQAINP